MAHIESILFLQAHATHHVTEDQKVSLAAAWATVFLKGLLKAALVLLCYKRVQGRFVVLRVLRAHIWRVGYFFQIINT